jgi:hypothetical protein
MLALGSVWGCGARTDLLGTDDSLGPISPAAGGSVGNPDHTAGAPSGVGGHTMQLDVTQCPSVVGEAWICETKFMCPGVTFQTVCYYQGSDVVGCRCLNLSNGNSALKDFPVRKNNPCFADAPSLCRP